MAAAIIATRHHRPPSRPSQPSPITAEHRHSIVRSQLTGAAGRSTPTAGPAPGKLRPLQSRTTEQPHTVCSAHDCAVSAHEPTGRCLHPMAAVRRDKGIRGFPAWDMERPGEGAGAGRSRWCWRVRRCQLAGRDVCFFCRLWGGGYGGRFFEASGFGAVNKAGAQRCVSFWGLHDPSVVDPARLGFLTGTDACARRAERRHAAKGVGGGRSSGLGLWRVGQGKNPCPETGVFLAWRLVGPPRSLERLQHGSMLRVWSGAATAAP